MRGRIIAGIRSKNVVACDSPDGDGDDNVIVNRTDSDDGNDADESDDDDDDDGGICGNELVDCVVGDVVGAEDEDEDNIELWY